MSESSYEETKRRDQELRAKAYKATYQILRISLRRYAVITSTSWCPGKYAHFNFVPGLENVSSSKAEEAATALNLGDKKEEDYA